MCRQSFRARQHNSRSTITVNLPPQRARVSCHVVVETLMARANQLLTPRPKYPLVMAQLRFPDRLLRLLVPAGLLLYGALFTSSER